MIEPSSAFREVFDTDDISIKLIMAPGGNIPTKIPMTPNTIPEIAKPQIGRASCRERVCAIV